MTEQEPSRQVKRRTLRERSKMAEMYYSTVLDMHSTAQAALGWEPKRSRSWVYILEGIDKLRLQRERSLGGRIEKLRGAISRRFRKDNGRDEGKGNSEAESGGDRADAGPGTDTDEKA